MKSGIRLTMSPHTTLVMNPTDAPGYALISIDNKDDIVIRGGRIQGDRVHHIGGEHNYCYGISIANGSRRVVIEGVEITDCEDDGIMIADYLPSLSEGRHSESITIKGVNSHHNGRQGLTISSGSDITVRESRFSHQTKHAPKSGIDIELESFDHRGVRNVEIIDNEFIDNSYAAVIITNMFNDVPASLSSNIRIRGNRVKAGQLGLYASGWVDGLDISNNTVALTCVVPQNCAALASAAAESKNVTITKNTVTSNSRVKNHTVGVMTYSKHGATITDNVLIGQNTAIVVGGNGAVVERNKIRAHQAEAIRVDAGEHAIRDNDVAR